MHTRNLDIGDQIILEMGGITYPSEVVGIIIHFPMVNGNFVITDLSRFVQLMDLESMALTDQYSRETWLTVEPDEHDALLTNLSKAGLEDSIAGNSKSQLEIFQNNLVFREVATAFDLNALVLIPLSVVGYTLIQVFAAQRRATEFNILEAMGLSKTQIRGLLLLDGVIFVILGIFIGTGIGFGLSTLMQPFLVQILPPLSGDFVLSRMLVNWSEMSLRFIVLVGFYGVGLLVLMVSAIRNLKSV
jgi:putative ABC transport system permease protein